MYLQHQYNSHLGCPDQRNKVCISSCNLRKYAGQTDSFEN